MPTKKQLEKKIHGAIQKKIGPMKPCVLCGQTAWVVSDRFIKLNAQKTFEEIRLSGDFFPIQPIICTNCGNTHFIDLAVIGFSDSDSLKVKKDDSAKQK